MTDCKTKTKLLEEVEHGARSLDAIKPHHKIELAQVFLDEYDSDSNIVNSLRNVLKYEDDTLYKLKCEVANSIIEDNYDILDELFDEAHAEFLDDDKQYFYTEL